MSEFMPASALAELRGLASGARSLTVSEYDSWLDAHRRDMLGTAATLKLFETAAGTGDTPLLTLNNTHHWRVYKERIEGEVADTLVAEIGHDPALTSDEVMDRVDRLKLENVTGLTDLAGLPMKAEVVSRPVDGRGAWILKGSEVVAGAR